MLILNLCNLRRTTAAMQLLHEFSRRSLSLRPCPPLSPSLCLYGGEVRFFLGEKINKTWKLEATKEHTARQTLAPFTHEALSGRCSRLFPGPWVVGGGQRQN